MQLQEIVERTNEETTVSNQTEEAKTEENN